MTEPSGLRMAAIEWLQAHSDGGREPLTREEIGNFAFQGRIFRLQAPYQGIWKPKGFEGALSVTTKFTRPGEKAPYEDDFSEDGVPTYMWRGEDPFHHENVGLRTAMDRGQPVIWFLGMGGKPPLYLPIAPMLVVDEDRASKRFFLTPVDDYEDIPALESSTVEGALKRYVIRQTKARVHQPAFRASVLTAYENRCSVCALAHPPLLDAAHIVADREERGIASVVNGLAMCKIHHAAFDENFLGVRPDHVVEIRRDLLLEVDGPMLRYGLQALHGQKLRCVPRSRRDYPRGELLELKYEEFKSSPV